MKNRIKNAIKQLSDFYNKDGKYKKEMKTFRISCNWSVYDVMEIKAWSLSEAIRIAEGSEGDVTLPTNPQY